MTRVEFAYSTTEDDEHEIQVYANLLRNEIRYEVDGNIVHIDYFHDNHELAAQGIENSAFSDFINTAEAEFEKHHPTTRKVEKSPVTIGSTVYLEDLILSSARAEYYDRAMKIRKSMFSVM